MAKDKETKMSGENSASGTVMDIPAKLIVADKDFNARKTMEKVKEGKKEKKGDEKKPDFDESCRELAVNIKKEGQLQPVMLEKRKDGKYFLVFGFRRFRAICGPADKGFLGQETIRATVVEPMADTDRLYVNMIENVARENLTSYDLSIRCTELVEKHSENGTRIAGRLNKSVSYINNLIRIQQKCIPLVLTRWKKEVTGEIKAGLFCTVDWLATLAKEDPDEQEKMYAAQIGKKSGDGEDGEDGESGGNGANDSAGPRRATLSQLKKALEKAKEKRQGAGEDTDDGAVLDGVIAALKFAIGATSMIPKVYKIPPKATAAEEN